MKRIRITARQVIAEQALLPDALIPLRGKVDVCIRCPAGTRKAAFLARAKIAYEDGRPLAPPMRDLCPDTECRRPCAASTEIESRHSCTVLVRQSIQ